MHRPYTPPENSTLFKRKILMHNQFLETAFRSTKFSTPSLAHVPRRESPNSFECSLLPQFRRMTPSAMCVTPSASVLCPSHAFSIFCCVSFSPSTTCSCLHKAKTTLGSKQAKALNDLLSRDQQVQGKMLVCLMLQS